MMSGGNSTDKNKGTPMKRAKWHLGMQFFRYFFRVIDRYFKYQLFLYNFFLFHWNYQCLLNFVICFYIKLLDLILCKFWGKCYLVILWSKILTLLSHSEEKKGRKYVFILITLFVPFIIIYFLIHPSRFSLFSLYLKMICWICKIF